MSESEWRKFQTSPEMDLFFKRLSSIKSLVKTSSEIHSDENVRSFARDIYDKIHALYKTSEELEDNFKDVIDDYDNTCYNKINELV